MLSIQIVIEKYCTNMILVIFYLKCYFFTFHELSDGKKVICREICVCLNFSFFD